MAAIAEYPCTSYNLGIPQPASAPTAAVVVIADKNFVDCTPATPVSIEITGHNLVTGQRVYIDQVSGVGTVADILNGFTFTITKVDANNFTLDATAGDGLTYDSGGFARLKPIDDNIVSTAYVYTYYTSWGEEGPPSDPSEIVDVSYEEGETVTITNTSTGPGANYKEAIMTKRLYRISSAGQFANTYQLVESGIALGSQPASDGVTDDDLGDPIDTLDNALPPDDMIGLKAMPNGILVGFDGRDICFCEPFLPHSWPVKYRIVLDYEVVGLGVIGNSVVAVTLGLPYIITGSHPNNMSTDKLEVNQACVAKQSVVDMGTGIIYASNDGLVYITTGGAQMITDKLIDPLVWRDSVTNGGWEPSSIVADFYEGRYVGRTNTGGNRIDFILEIADDGINLSLLSGASFGDATHNDLEADKIYANVNSNLVQIEGTSTNMALLYETKKIRTNGPVNFGAMQVWADSYPGTSDLQVKVYADDVLKHTENVSSNDPFRLPAGFMSENWEVTFSSKHEIQKAILAETMADLRKIL